MRARPVLAAILATALASPALALGDLTGTWEGKMACDGASLPVFLRTRSELVLRIDDGPSGEAYAEIAGPYHLRVIPHPDSPKKGRVTGVQCSISQASGGIALDLAVKVKEGSEAGTMRGTMLIVSLLAAPTTSTCKVRLKRTTTAIPAPILGCPP